MREKITKDMIADRITGFVWKADQGLWRAPLVGFADAKHQSIRNLRKTAHPLHQLPEEVLPQAGILVVYFIPFQKEVPQSNREEGLASPLWARAYEETNAMMGQLNAHLLAYLRGKGCRAETSPEADIFYRDKVTSHWSFRHLAYAAGLGTFGLNNMLITEAGCAGRINAVVTDLDLEPDRPRKEEACLYKRKGTCGVCVSKCPSQALTVGGFDRYRCYDRCLENAAVYREFGSSYASGLGPEGEVTAPGAEVCGKCLIGLPCTFRRP